jgi:hypothetical protein
MWISTVLAILAVFQTFTVPRTWQTSDDGEPLPEIQLAVSEKKSIVNLIRANAPTDYDKFGDVDLTTQSVDLGEGPENGLVVTGRLRGPLCGNANCLLAVFRKTGPKWKLVNQIGLTAGFAVLESKHKGLKDIVTLGNAGGGNDIIEVMEFNGTLYRNAACYFLNGPKLSVGKLSPSMGCVAQ